MHPDLRHAINNSTIQILRATLYELLQTMPETEDIVRMKLELPLMEKEDPVWLHCARCDYHFKAEDADEEWCAHHPGEIEEKPYVPLCTGYARAYDSDTDAPSDDSASDANEEDELPEGFYWSCCGEAAGSQPCSLTLHPEHEVRVIDLVEDGERIKYALVRKGGDVVLCPI